MSNFFKKLTDKVKIAYHKSMLEQHYDYLEYCRQQKETAQTEKDRDFYFEEYYDVEAEILNRQIKLKKLTKDR